MSTVYKFRIWCSTENAYVYSWDTTTPTTCPNDTAHTIDANTITSVEKVSTIHVKAEENSEGYFETSMVTVDVPTGSVGDVIEHDATWPMDILLWKTSITPTPEMVGDSISVIGSPETTVGVLTAPVNIGDTVLNVNSTVTANTQRGFLITVDDTVNKDVLGRCIAVDSAGGTITVETPTSFAFTPGVPVKIGIYILKDIYLSDTNAIDFGTKGMKGKTITAGMILRIYYTNNSGTSKTVRWRPEYYAMG